MGYLAMVETVCCPAWKAITRLSRKEPGRLVASDGVDHYVDVTQRQFGTALSIRTHVPFSEYMTIAECVRDGSPLILTLAPAT